LNKGVSLTILLISILLIVVSTEPHEAFAKKDVDTEKHDGKDKKKEDDKKKKEKEDDKKKKEKEDDKKKKEKDEQSHVPSENVDDEPSHVPSENVDDEPSHVPSENVDDEPSHVPSENVDDEQNLILHTKNSANNNAPFFGTDSFGNRYIDNGFTFNDFVTDVENFKTHMPLQTIQVGESNTAVLKIYNHRGISTLEHVELVFGFDQKQSDGQSTNSIIWKQNFKGTQSVSTKGSDNLLMDVNAVGEADDKVMSITFTFAFREPMEKSKIGVVVWDQDRNSRTAYFNDGIEVVGKSLNPPKIVTILDDKGYPVTLTMTGKNTGIDEEGNIWTHNSPWTKLSQPVEDQLSRENLDPGSAHGFDRMNSMFDSYKNVQAQEAQKKLIEILGGHNISNFSD
jgi:hypothetical protein